MDTAAQDIVVDRAGVSKVLDTFDLTIEKAWTVATDSLQEEILIVEPSKEGRMRFNTMMVVKLEQKLRGKFARGKKLTVLVEGRESSFNKRYFTARRKLIYSRRNHAGV